MTRCYGLAVIRSLGMEQRAARFLALSASDAPEDVIELVRAGARGYVTKTISATDVAAAIKHVAAGDVVFSPQLAGFVFDVFSGALPPAANPELELLTRREIDVLELIARGYLYKEIAQELRISIRTVETHVSAVLRKLHLSNRHQLARWATVRRFVD